MIIVINIKNEENKKGINNKSQETNKDDDLIITRERFMEEISSRGEIPISEVKKIFSLIEENIFRYLSETQKGKTVLLKIFKGLNIICKYIQPQNSNGCIVSKGLEKIWAKAHITRHYNRKLNDYYSK